MAFLYTVSRSYAFEAGHFLPLVREGHKCKRPHGHNYVLEVTARGPLDRGFVIDFWDLDAIVKPLLEQVDHVMLNDVPGLENPTAEIIAGWFYEQIAESVTQYYEVEVESVTIYETPTCRATVKGLL